MYLSKYIILDTSITVFLNYYLITQSRLGQFIAHKLLPANIKSWLRDFVANSNKGKIKTSSLGRWQLTPEERNLALNRLAEDLKRLESDFGIDIQKHWHIQADMHDKTGLK